MKGENLMGKIYSVGMTIKGYKVYHGRIIVYSEKPKDAGY